MHAMWIRQLDSCEGVIEVERIAGYSPSEIFETQRLAARTGPVGFEPTTFGVGG